MDTALPGHAQDGKSSLLVPTENTAGMPGPVAQAWSLLPGLRNGQSAPWKQLTASPPPLLSLWGLPASWAGRRAGLQSWSGDPAGQLPCREHLSALWWALWLSPLG